MSFASLFSGSCSYSRYVLLRRNLFLSSTRYEEKRLKYPKLNHKKILREPGKRLAIEDEIYNSLAGKVRFNTYAKSKNDRVRWKIWRNGINRQRLAQSSFQYALSLKYVHGIQDPDLEELEKERERGTEEQEDDDFHFPYSIVTEVEMLPQEAVAVPDEQKQEEVKALKKHYLNLQDVMPKPIMGRRWMSDYEFFEEDSDEEYEFGESEVEYGTPNRKIPTSPVPCGGCGARLHCKDQSIPGYLPQELFLKYKLKELYGIKCQRCSFLNNYNTALSVNVDPNVYPDLIARIKKENCLVILMVDMTDFPCSTWPDIMNLIGRKPVIVVGNKIDLVPGDCSGWLEHAKECLIKSLPKNANIVHVALTSAKTGYGLEPLLSEIFGKWNAQGDIYIVGCTNVGKSSMFNALIYSDLCHARAIDVMQRATISSWPGTTLNLLKFPIAKLQSWKAFLRANRLKKEYLEKKMESRLMAYQRFQFKTNFSKLPKIIGTVGISVTTPASRLKIQTENPSEVFDMPTLSKEFLTSKTLTFDPEAKAYKNVKWCYDTPGVIHNEQIINILTTDELMKTLPSRTIKPIIASIYPGFTLFIGGLARIDLLSCDYKFCRIVVYSSGLLPLTLADTKYAEEVYERLVGTPFMAVPFGSTKRLEQFPPLKYGQDYEVEGSGFALVTSDIVLSSVGWIAVSSPYMTKSVIRPWTPDGKGIYFRKTPLLRYTMAQRRRKIQHTPIYNVKSL